MNNSVKGCLGCFGIVVIGMIGCIYIVSSQVAKERKEAAASLEQADELFKAGNQAAAIEKYKRYFDHATSKPQTLKKIVEYEVAKGDAAEASRWIEKGIEEHLSVNYDTKAAKDLLANVTKQVDDKRKRREAEQQALAAKRQTEQADKAKAEAAQKIRDTISISAPELLAQYEANEVAADQAFKGKWLLVTGKAGNIGKDILDSMYVTLKGGNEFEIFSIQCFFRKEHENVLASMKQGTTYSIRGRCDGKFGNVMLKDCELAR